MTVSRRAPPSRLMEIIGSGSPLEVIFELHSIRTDGKIDDPSAASTFRRREDHIVLRAVILHFMVGHDHPFVDGNGRVARAVLLVHDSTRVSPGYFVLHQLDVLLTGAAHSMRHST